MIRLYRLLYVLFYRRLSLRPDGRFPYMRGRINTITGMAAQFFHVRICPTCIRRRAAAQGKED